MDVWGVKNEIHILKIGSIFSIEVILSWDMILSCNYFIFASNIYFPPFLGSRVFLLLFWLEKSRYSIIIRLYLLGCTHGKNYPSIFSISTINFQHRYNGIIPITPKLQSIRIWVNGIPRTGPQINASGIMATQQNIPQLTINLLRTGFLYTP